MEEELNSLRYRCFISRGTVSITVIDFRLSEFLLATWPGVVYMRMACGAALDSCRIFRLAASWALGFY